MMRALELARMLLVGTKSARAAVLLVLHLLWSRKAFDRAFMTLLCVFVAASRRLADRDPPFNCYLHEVLTSVWRALGLRDPAAFVGALGQVIDYLYRRDAIAFSGLTWFWEGADTSQCPSYLARVVKQGYVYFDAGQGEWQKEHVYTRYTLKL
jgi:hypothetical protein